MQSTTVVGLITLGFGLLVNTGALVFFFRYAVRMALIEAQLQQNNLPQMAVKLAFLERAVMELTSVAAKLNQLDSIHTKVNLLAELFKGAIPRAEVEGALAGISKRLENLEAKSD